VCLAFVAEKTVVSIVRRGNLDYLQADTLKEDFALSIERVFIVL
jgi:hypothetical protein